MLGNAVGYVCIRNESTHTHVQLGIKGWDGPEKCRQMCLIALNEVGDGCCEAQTKSSTDPFTSPLTNCFYRASADIIYSAKNDMKAVLCKGIFNLTHLKIIGHRILRFEE